jgi:hypothetical protein
MKRVSLVKIDDKYAVQIVTGIVFKNTKYLDLDNYTWTWARGTKWFKDCLASKERAQEAFDNYRSEPEVLDTKLIK